MHRWLATGLLLALLAPSSLQAQAAAPSASDLEQARLHYERGLALYDEAQFESQYTAAMAEFEAAYRLSHRPAMLFNIAQLHARLGHAVEAVDTFAHYLAEAGEIDPERRAVVEAEMALQQTRVGAVDIDVAYEGAVVVIDGVSVGTTPFEAPIRVSAGDHVVEVRVPDEVTEPQRVRVAGGATVRVHVSITRRAPLPVTAPSDPTPVLTITGFTLAGIGLVTFGVAGALVLVEDGALPGRCAMTGCGPADTQMLFQSTITADIGLGVTALGAILGIIGLATEGHSERTSRAQLHWRGLGVEGSF
jgi:hypothetical protein